MSEISDAVKEQNLTARKITARFAVILSEFGGSYHGAKICMDVMDLLKKYETSSEIVLSN